MTHAEETEFLPSASNGEQWYHCPGSLALEREAPPEIPSVEAQQGSEIAAALESDDFKELDEKGRTIAEKLKAQREEALDAWQKEFDEPAAGLDVYKEERWWIRDMNRKACSAKPDFTAIGRKHAFGVDDKSGYLQVTAAYRNYQARIQAVAIAAEFRRVESVRVVISQYRFRGRVDPVDYDPTNLAAARRELFFNLWRTEQPHAPRVPGPWCRYCRAKTLCPEYASYALLPMVHTGSTPLNKQDAQAVAYKLTLEQLAYIVLRFPMLHNFEDAVKERLKGLSDEELASVGLRRQATGSVSVCEDVNKLWRVVHEAKLLTVLEFQGCLKPVIGQVEAKLAERIVERDGETQAAAFKIAKRILAPAVVQKPKQPTLKAIKGEKTEE